METLGDNQNVLRQEAWRLAGLLLLVLAALVAINWSSRSRPSSARQGESQSGTATSIIDSPSGQAVRITREIEGEPPQSVSLSIAGEPTLLEAMQQAAELDPGWRFMYQGRGSGAMLTELAGRRSEGRGGNNWIYEVNGQRAEVGFGTYQVEAGDDILWKFAPYD